jgi:hypothetical protein
MASLKKQHYTAPLLAKAEVFELKGVRFAKWRDRSGKLCTGRVTTGVDGQERIIVESATWTARYRDHDGRAVEVSTGCRDKDAAQKVLSDLLGLVEKRKAGILSPAEVAVAGAGKLITDEHLRDFSAHLRSGDVCDDYHDLTMGHLRLVCGERNWLP